MCWATFLKTFRRKSAQDVTELLRNTIYAWVMGNEVWGFLFTFCVIKMKLKIMWKLCLISTHISSWGKFLFPNLWGRWHYEPYNLKVYGQPLKGISHNSCSKKLYKTHWKATANLLQSDSVTFVFLWILWYFKAAFLRNISSRLFLKVILERTT